MVKSAHTDAYRELADLLIQSRLAEADLPNVTASLPLLNRELLDTLAVQAARFSLSQPRHGWAMMAVTDAAAAHISDNSFLSALAAWYLARSANEWCRPERIDAALRRAHLIFTELGEDTWIAACNWQQYAQPWLRNNFQETVEVLTEALVSLEQGGFHQFVPHCRLSLAFAHILLADFSRAKEQIAISEQTFNEQEDMVNLARCWQHRASALRRQLRFPEAMNYLEQAKQVFNREGAVIDLGKTYYQLAYCQLDYYSRYQTAERLFTYAAALFAEQELELWQAFCLNGLVQTYNNAGRLTKSHRLLTQIRQIYDRYSIEGLQADNAIENGTLALFRGDYSAAINFFRRAETKYEHLKLSYMVALSILYQGDAYSQAGDYHRALHCLEKAYRQFQTLKDNGRLADCQTRLTHAWLELGRLGQAALHLDQATTYYVSTRQPAELVAIYILRARLLLKQNDVFGAVDWLRRALAKAEQQDGALLIARSRRLLGGALCAVFPNSDEALHYLKTAEADFNAMGAVIEEATCHLALGHFHLLVGDTASAHASWTTALTLNQGVTPEVEWQAYAGLAKLAQRSDMIANALEQYRLAISSLVRLRHSLWQPALAGSYFSRPAPMLDEAVGLAVCTGSVAHAIYFIEASKARVFTGQLSAPTANSSTAVELIDLATEIRWLQQKIQDSATITLPKHQSVRILHQQFIRKVQEYDTLAEQLERIQSPERETRTYADSFDLARFRQQANAKVDGQWIAVNYYLTEDQLYGVVITPDDEYIWNNEMTGPVQLALDTCTRGEHNRSWSSHHLALLGNWLISPLILELLTPNTYLLLAPHRKLHRIPWAALFVGQMAEALVTRCIPTIIPSWHSLLYLWQRKLSNRISIHSGLILAVSDFQNRHISLPQVKREVDQLIDFLGINVQVLREAEATVPGLSQLAEENSLSSFDFLHIASHAFSDQLTGRLSGLALYDQDLWLDDLRQLAPLPWLVTLSACSGMLSQIYGGDEQSGLAVTCLVAGAQSVVGTLWAIFDETTPDFMYHFYRHLYSGTSVAQALALAQRSALQSGLDIMHWGSFQCLGQP